MAVTMFKPGYEGERPSVQMTGPERQALRQGKPDLIRRLHDAMLTLSVQNRSGPDRIRSNFPAYAPEAGDEQDRPRRAPFRPTAAQVTDMPAALALLDGLTKPFFQVVMLRALHEFSRRDGGLGDWPWAAIGGRFGLSDKWAEAAYEAAIVQAARRAGVLSMFQTDYGVYVAGVWLDRGWLTHIGAAADPKQAVANLKVKCPVRLEQAFTVWVAGQPVARRMVDEVKPGIRGLLSHGSWYKAHPDVLAQQLVERARAMNADWLIEDIAVKGQGAAAAAA